MTNIHSPSDRVILLACLSWLSWFLLNWVCNLKFKADSHEQSELWQYGQPKVVSYSDFTKSAIITHRVKDLGVILDLVMLKKLAAHDSIAGKQTNKILHLIS